MTSAILIQKLTEAQRDLRNPARLTGRMLPPVAYRLAGDLPASRYLSGILVEILKYIFWSLGLS